jgi:isochorismate synthase EntC
VPAAPTAVLPAGAGIVDGSDGAAELAETRLKQRVVVDALRGGA